MRLGVIYMRVWDEWRERCGAWGKGTNQCAFTNSTNSMSHLNMNETRSDTDVWIRRMAAKRGAWDRVQWHEPCLKWNESRLKGKESCLKCNESCLKCNEPRLLHMQTRFSQIPLHWRDMIYTDNSLVYPLIYADTSFIYTHTSLIYTVLYTQTCLAYIGERDLYVSLI